MNDDKASELFKTRTILVTCGVIWQGRKLLIAQRKPDSTLESLKWEFPGGKIEFSEDPPTALKREIMEELNIEIDIGEIFYVSSHNYHPGPKDFKHVLLLAYSCAYKKGKIKSLDVHDFKWVTVDNLDKYNFAAADIPIVKRLQSLYSRPDRKDDLDHNIPGLHFSDRDCMVSVLKEEVACFVEERAWEQFHSPKNLSMSIAIEAAELMEHFQWVTGPEARLLTRDPDKYEQVIQEVADITIYILSLCNSLNINLSEAVGKKLKLNREKYPMEKYWGNFKGMLPDKG